MDSSGCQQWATTFSWTISDTLHWVPLLCVKANISSLPHPGQRARNGNGKPAGTAKVFSYRERSCFTGKHVFCSTKRWRKIWAKQEVQLAENGSIVSTGYKNGWLWWFSSTCQAPQFSTWMMEWSRMLTHSPVNHASMGLIGPCQDRSLKDAGFRSDQPC